MPQHVHSAHATACDGGVRKTTAVDGTSTAHSDGRSSDDVTVDSGCSTKSGTGADGPVDIAALGGVH